MIQEPGTGEQRDDRQATAVKAAEQPTPAPAPRAPGNGGFSQLARVAIVLAAFALALSLFTDFSAILAPVFLTVNMVITAFPIYKWLVRVGVPRVIGAIATGLTVLAVLVILLGSIVWSVSAMVRELGNYSEQFMDLYYRSIEFLGTLGFDRAMLMEQLRSISPGSVFNVVGNVASAGSSVGGILLVIVVTTVFMVFDMPSVKQRFNITDRLHPRFTVSIESFALGIRRYWLVTTVFGLIVAAADWVLLVILGVPLPLVWAVLSFVTNYIPNVGFIIGLIPPALLALFEKGPGTALIVVIGYSVLNFVIQSIIQPKFTGEAVGVTPTVTFLSLLLWTAVFGALGALIAVPFTLMIKALLIDNDPQLRWVNAIISSSPETILGDGPEPKRGSKGSLPVQDVDHAEGARGD